MSLLVGGLDRCRRLGAAVGSRGPRAWFKRMGRAGRRSAITTASSPGSGLAMVSPMASNPTSMSTAARPSDGRQPSGAGVLLSSADFNALMDELESLCAWQRSEQAPARRARLDGADLLAALEGAGVHELRIAQVAALVQLASMLDDVVTVDGGAGLGSTVKVADRAGRTTEYELVGRAAQEPPRQQVTLASTTGKALLGARPGDALRVTLPNGRQRRVRVINVTPSFAGSLRARLEHGAAST
jgi:transcription elongation factor GreA